MHELSIAMSLIEIIKEECLKNEVQKLKKVKLVVGELAGIVPESLQFGFEVVSEGTPAEGAELEIELRPVRGQCQECGHEFEVQEFRFRCPSCESTSVKRVGGDELYIDYLETAE